MSGRRGGGRYGDQGGSRGGYRGRGGDDGPSYYRRNEPYDQGGRDSRPSRGGDRGFRDRGGRGGGRGGFGGQDGGSEKPEFLLNDRMFEESAISRTASTANPVIEGCGELYGTFGEKQLVHANYFRVTNLPDRTLYQYAVEFEPVLENPRARHAILMKLDIMRDRVVAFDGAVLYVPFSIEDGEYQSIDRNDNPYKIHIKYVATVSPGTPTASTVINLIMRRVMRSLKLKLIKRHYFDPSNPEELEATRLTVWPGYSSTLVYCGKTPFYCVDVAHHVMRQQSALDYLYDIVRSTRDTKAMRSELERMLVGKIVMTRYNNRSYRIDAVDWERSPESKFKKKDGSEISYEDYYKTQYGIALTDLKQPLLVSQLKERRRLHEQKQSEQRGEEKAPTEMIVHLIPELVFLTGISEEVRSDFHKMRTFAELTRVGPTRRANNIFKFLERVYNCDEAKEYLDSWGVQFKKELVTIEGRRLAPENLYFAGEPIQVNSNTFDWTGNLRNVRLLNPAAIKRWVVYSGYRDQQNVDSFLHLVFEKAQQLNFSLSDPDMKEIHVDNSTDVMKQIEKDISMNYELAMFIIPQNRKDIYDMIKVKSCVDQPMTTQVILSSTLKKKNAISGIATKVAIQLCVKRGGEPWGVAIPVKTKMVVGIDVCHDTENKRNSWLGFVASLNDSFTRYYSRATRQPPKTELADSLNINMKNALEAYKKLNNRLPDSIYIFRDGVGDGQLEMVKLQEIPSVTASLESVYAQSGASPSLAYIIVRKRVNTRLFVKSQNEVVNPGPGVIVDRVVTKEDYPNFFLISQKVTQGTVNPTHYIVLHNTSRLSTTNVQRLAYKLCHLYFNWTGTVRVPAPCQYAHKLCFLVSQSVKKEPSSQLANLLYYL